MKKQKICIIGGGLTGLITALSLSKLNINIDIVPGNIGQNPKSSRTIAISQKNFDFLKTMNIFKFKKDKFWACSKMQLFTQNTNENFLKVFELDKNNNKEIFYMIEKNKIIQLLKNKIKNIKSISLKKNKNVSEINNTGLMQSIKYGNNSSRYNLVIICTGNNSDLVKKYFCDQYIENSYKEVAITTILNHSHINNNVAKQIFLTDEILALLPISNTKTSIVWTKKKEKYNNDDIYFKKRIKFYTKNFLKKIKFHTKIESNNLSFLIRSKYFKDRILLLGDALHMVHPLVGQGFNMTLRDIASLKKKLKNKINLGLDIGSSDILTEFSREIKPRNFISSIGIDLIRKSFSLKKNSIKKIRTNALQVLNKNNFAKKIVFGIADEGIKL